MEQYAEQTGEPIDLVYEKFGLEKPEIPQGFEMVWDWFWELSDARGSGFCPIPLSWSDVDAWGRLSGVNVEPWLMKIFRAMDDAWIVATVEEQKKKSWGKK